MITLDVKYFSESDYAEAQEFIKKLREMFPVFFHEESCNKINTVQLSSNDIKPPYQLEMTKYKEE
ncbi:MAG: hypothetical protein WC623_22065 [Pedobacter sp.]|uniref:hypothetical protein n=1 Tax=Pedobacter sp. TaxID=1411316 RepID=UPI0035674C50